jgi:phage terminase large subunit GpA-like protein
VTDARAMLNAAFWAGLRPDPVMSIAEWAALHRVLSRSTSGEPGPWRNERTPYLIEIMEALSPSSTVETVVFVAGSQIGKTEVGNNFMGYVVDQAPGPMLFVLPTEGAAENVSKERLKPLFEESPTLRGKVKDARKKDSGNTLLRKEFPGGFLKLVSADSPAQLRSTPARYLFGDEVDAYPYSTGHEGDPCQLARRGQITFRRRKALWTSTPTLAGQSKIWKLLERTDIRHYLVPCPHCGHEQRLVWAQLKFNPEAHGAELRASVHYECEACQAAIDEGAKTEMLARGRWEPSQEAKDAKSRGYHLSTLYSPWYAWAELAQDFLNAKNDPAELKVFVNTKLGECWEEKGEKPDWRRLYERREAWPRGTVPFGATVLTAAVDVQGNRLEYQVDGWGPDRERWGDRIRSTGRRPEPGRGLARALGAPRPRVAPRVRRRDADPAHRGRLGAPGHRGLQAVQPATPASDDDRREGAGEPADPDPTARLEDCEDEGRAGEGVGLHGRHVAPEVGALPRPPAGQAGRG